MSFSLTKVTTHEKCALKYKFRYILNLPETRGPAATRGVNLHKNIEDYIRESIPLPAELNHYQAWLASMQGPNSYPEHKIAVDDKWQLCGWEDPDCYIRSILDLKYVVSDVSVAIYDWKSGKVYDDHDDQKRLYSAMTLAEHPDALEFRAIHVYVDLGKNKEMVFHRDQLPAFQQDWDRRIAAVAQDSEYIPSPGYGCKWCGYSKVVGGPCRF